MAQTADQLAARQKQQADHVRDLMAQQNAARASGQPPNYPSAQEIDKMVNDRQQVTDRPGASHPANARLARGSSRPRNRRLPSKLRSALDAMDENDLGTRMQRSSDWLRSGNFSDPLETALTSDLQKLGQQVSDAARALGSGAAHFQGRRAQPGHGRSVPSARPTRRPRRTLQLSTWTGSAGTRPAHPNGQSGNPATLAQWQPGQPALTQRAIRPTRTTGPGWGTGPAGQAGGQPGQGGQAGGQRGGGQAGPGRQPPRRSRRQPGRRRGQSRLQRVWRPTIPAIRASPGRPWRPNRVPTRPTRSARSTRD